MKNMKKYEKIRKNTKKYEKYEKNIKGPAVQHWNVFGTFPSRKGKKGRSLLFLGKMFEEG
jgi:hypothetical protein